MADTPLLMDTLTLAEKVQLGSLAAHPGYAVLQKLILATVDEANKKVMKVDPADANYTRILAATQQEARATNKLALALLKSIAFHVAVGAAQEKQTELQKVLDPK